MFDWFWAFLYSISKAFFKVCDLLMDCALKLVGVQDIIVDGESTDFLTYLMRSERVSDAIKYISILAFIILIIFTIFAIIKAVAKEQPGMTPAQICVKALKSLLMFLFVPTIMISLTYFLNVFMIALFNATTYGDHSSIGAFMFVTFGQEGLNDTEVADFLSGVLDYRDTSVVQQHLDLADDFNFVFSWIVGFSVMANLSSSLLMFIDRAISIVILYLAAPFEIASTVIDDGAHFKTWREQVLTKYLTGYGIIIAMNIYILIMGMITKSTVHFFDNGLLNYVAKILILLGGSLTMKKSQALVASLLSQGGANEVNDPAFKGNALKDALTAPFKGAQKAYNFGKDVSKRGFGTALGQALGFKTDFDYRKDNLGAPDKTGEGSESSDNQNTQKPGFENNGDKDKELKDALEQGNDTDTSQGSDNTNSDKTDNTKKDNNVLNNTINNGGNLGNETKGDDKKEG